MVVACACFALSCQRQRSAMAAHSLHIAHDYVIMMQAAYINYFITYLHIYYIHYLHAYIHTCMHAYIHIHITDIDSCVHTASSTACSNSIQPLTARVASPLAAHRSPQQPCVPGESQLRLPCEKCDAGLVHPAEGKTWEWERTVLGLLPADDIVRKLRFISPPI